MQNRRVAVRGVIFRDGKLFCVRQKGYNGSLSGETNEYWNTPGGGVDVGEPLLPALERELIEELGVKPIVGNLLYVQQFQHKDWEQMELFFHITNPDDFADIDIHSTTHGATEIAQFSFVDPTTENVLPKFLTAEPLSDHIANFPGTKFFNYLG